MRHLPTSLTCVTYLRHLPTSLTGCTDRRGPGQEKMAKVQVQARRIALACIRKLLVGADACAHARVRLHAGRERAGIGAHGLHMRSAARVLQCWRRGGPAVSWCRAARDRAPFSRKHATRPADGARPGARTRLRVDTLARAGVSIVVDLPSRTAGCAILAAKRSRTRGRTKVTIFRTASCPQNPPKAFWTN